MKYIDAIKGSLIALVIFVVGSYLIVGNGPSNEIQIVFTVSSFLFAILSGFFISRFNARYDRVRELIVIEDAHFLSIYKIASFYGKEFLEKITDLIDKYYILAYDMDTSEGHTEYKYNAKYFLGIYDEMGKLDQKYRSENSFGIILSDLVEIENSRNARSVLAEERVSIGQWAILVALSAIVVFSVFYMQMPTIYSQTVTVLLSTVVVMVLLILRDLQNMRLNGKLVAVESGQEVFEDIGRLRYYHQKYLDEGSIEIPEFVKSYRLGTHIPGQEPKIKVINR